MTDINHKNSSRRPRPPPIRLDRDADDIKRIYPDFDIEFDDWVSNHIKDVLFKKSIK